MARLTLAFSHTEVLAQGVLDRCIHWSFGGNLHSARRLPSFFDLIRLVFFEYTFFPSMTAFTVPLVI